MFHFPLTLAQTNGMVGFANCTGSGLDGVTGGGSGKVVHVKTRADFNKYVVGNTPYVIIIDNDIEGSGANGMKDPVSVGSNKTIIGSGAGKTLRGICIDMSDQSNVIFRNLYITKGNDDAIAMRNCHHIWVDHCDLSDSYDGLLDFTVGSDFMTCSWTKLHNHDKVSITNSGTCHYEDYGKEHVTFAHCWFDKNTQRNPRIGYGQMHIYNCYWTDISSYCIGFHSQAQVQSMNNYFTASAHNPFCNQYTDQLPYTGFLTDNGSFFANGKPASNVNHPYSAATFLPEEYYAYAFDILPAADVAQSTPGGVGPQPDLMYEPILHPGNGAVDIAVGQKLSWGNIEGMTSSRIYFGTSPSQLTEIDTDTPVLQPSTTYYWKVIATIGEKEYSTSVHQFTTASEKPALLRKNIGGATTDLWLCGITSSSAYCSQKPLAWRPSADAVEYSVYLSEIESELENNLIGKTKLTSIVPSQLQLGKTYYCRIDALTSSGKTIKGDVCTISTNRKAMSIGKNEAEELYLGGIAFPFSYSSFSGGKGVRGDQGAGAVIGVFDGVAGTYALTTGYIGQTLGPTQMALSVNGKKVDEWLTAVSSEKEERHTRHTVLLNPGDEIRLDFVAGYVDGGLNEAYGLIDYINITEASGDVIDITRPSGKHHSPEYTRGYDCEYLKPSDFLFKDELGTVGDYGDMQVKDEYCSWITKNADSFTLYLKNTAVVKASYTSGTNKEEYYDKTKNISVNIPADGLKAIMLYKTEATGIIHHSPVTTSTYDFELVSTPDILFKDNNGLKGPAGMYQVRDEYDAWCKFTSDNNQVKTAERTAYIHPITEKSVSTQWKGTTGAVVGYVVSANKYMTHYICDCSRLKFFVTGSSSQNENIALIEVTEMVDDAEIQGTNQKYYTPNCAGKDKSSSMLEIELDGTKKYSVAVKSYKNDVFVYAIKLWHYDSEADGIKSINTTMTRPDNVIYDLQGRRIATPEKGRLYIMNGKKIIF